MPSDIVCAILKCNNRRNSGFSLFRIPEEPKLKFKWMHFLENNEFSRDKNELDIFLCQEHFRDEDIMKSDTRFRLKKGSIPFSVSSVNIKDKIPAVSILFYE